MKNEDEEESSVPVTFYNPPYSTWVYSDIIAKIDYVCVAVPIFAGSTDVRFTVNEDGMKAVINFIWPKAIFQPAVLFREKIDGGLLKITDPIAHAFGATMIREGLTDSSKPRGQIIVELPRKVRREPSSWTFESIKEAGGSVCFIRFTAYVNEIFVQEADTAFNF